MTDATNTAVLRKVRFHDILREVVLLGEVTLISRNGDNRGY